MSGGGSGSTTIDVRELRDPALFLSAAEPLLLADEARHSLLLGIASTLADDPSLFAAHRLWTVEDRGEVVGAALRTPPHNLVLARPRLAEALDVLAERIDDDLPGAIGALPEVERFAAAWATRTGATPRRRFAQGIHAAERIEQPRGVAGTMRAASEDDRELAEEWWRAFAIEALHDEGGDERIAHSVDSRLRHAGSGIAVWEDSGAVVSLAGYGGPTPNGIRIGPVYTPPEQRGRGYASALVAMLSAQLLAGGRRFCFLYTNLANPTANRIYARIGYRRVCDSAELVFD